jgi:hypothetical protein
MIVLAMATMLVGKPNKIQTEEIQQSVVSYNVQIVGSEIGEINEPPIEIPQEGYITINDVVDAWDITLDYDTIDVIEYDYKIEKEE